MTTDPKAHPGGHHHSGEPEVDPVTGYDTTGHEWGGIKELNTPFPRIALVALALTFAYAVVAWILLPAWPLGRDYTHGLLDLDQGEVAVAGYRELSGMREGWLSRFDAPDFAALEQDADLMAAAMPAAHRLFRDNCAVCHGMTGGGGPGFPVLADGYWLWGGTPEDIAETLSVGINSEHPDTRYAEMPVFDWLERADRTALAEYVAGLPAGGADPESPAGMLFEENCAACHGEGGEGGLLNGAPSLTDASVIYGQDAATVEQTLRHGRMGVMPYWSDRLSAAEINLLALYVSRFASGAEEAAP